MKRWVSGSSLKRALKCPASTVLEQINKPFSPNALKAGEFGTKAHHYVETGEILPGISEWAGRFDRLFLYPDSGFHECVAWYKPLTGEFGLRPPCGPRKHRDYDDIHSDAIVCTIDYILLKGGRLGIPVVDDLKTTSNSFSVPPPSDPQLSLAACIVASIFDTDVLRSVTWIPRYPKGKVPIRRREVMTRGEAEMFRIKLDALHGNYLLESRRKRLGEVLTTKKNSECKYCPSRHVCPEFNK